MTQVVALYYTHAHVLKTHFSLRLSAHQQVAHTRMHSLVKRIYAVSCIGRLMSSCREMP